MSGIEGYEKGDGVNIVMMTNRFRKGVSRRARDSGYCIMVVEDIGKSRGG